MFQYAAGRALSLRLDKTLALDITFYSSQHLRSFHLTGFNTRFSDSSIALSSYRSRRSPLYWYNKVRGKKTVVLEDPVWTLLPEYFSVESDIVILDGYWAWPHYFESIRSVLLEEFSLVDKWKPEYDEWRLDISGKNSIAVHIRRGDYLSDPSANKNFASLDIAYYSKALAFFSDKVHQPVFCIFSDDINWVRDNWGKLFNEYGEIVFVEDSDDNTPALELKKMSACQHQIIANSSFSWWGAWLNENPEKIIVQPQVWYKNTEWQALYNKGEMNTAKGWIKL